MGIVGRKCPRKALERNEEVDDSWGVVRDQDLYSLWSHELSEVMRMTPEFPA